MPLGEKAGRPERSAEVTSKGGNIKRFSNRDDLITWLIASGVTASEDELYVQAPTSAWRDMVHAWIGQGATGCVFAQRRSRSAGAAQWLGIDLKSPPEQIELDGLQELLRAASDAQAILLVFPRATELSDLADIVAAFNEHDAWICERVPREDGEEDEHVEVGIRWKLPDSKYRSEAIGFGPIESFPVTRQAPVTALAFRTHPPSTPEKNNRVHLAQMPYDEQEIKRTDWFWERTKEQRADLLNGTLEHAARARVTWRLPAELVAGIIT